MYLLVNTIRFIASLIPAFLCLLIPLYFYNALYPDYRALIVLSTLIPFLITLFLELTGTFAVRSVSTATAAACGIAGVLGLVVEYRRLTANLTEPVLAVLRSDPGYFLDYVDKALVMACVVCIAVAIFHNAQHLDRFRHKRKARVNKTAHGSASWLSAQEALKEAFGFGELVVGRHRTDLLRVDGSGHLLTIAGSGSGKTTAVSIPNGFTWCGNLVATDPKGEISSVVQTARERLGQQVLVIGPNESSGASINVLDWIDTTQESAIENVDAIISWLDAGSADGKQSENESFTVNAKSVIKTVILAVLYSPELSAREKNLATVRDYLTRSDLKALLETIAATDRKISFGAMQQLASQLLSIASSHRTWSGVIAHVEQLTAWLSTPSLRRLVVGNRETPRLDDIISGRFDVFLSIPLKTLNATPAVARLLLGSLLNGVYERYHRSGGTNARTLFLLDEMPRLKRMELLETARDAGRGYGVTLWAIVQDLGQLEKWYGKAGVRSWIENSQVRTFFGVNDVETAETISKMLGKETIETETQGKSHSQSSQAGKLFGQRSASTSYHRALVGKPLMTADEILTMKTASNGTAEEQIIFRRGYKPFRTALAKYYEMPEFQL